MALECQGIDYKDPANIDKVVEILKGYMDKYPKTTHPLRLILKWAPADSAIFKDSLVKYLKPLVIKGVPSLINDLKIFYKESPEKAAVLGSVIDAMSDSMEKQMVLCPEDEEELDPTVQLWLYLFQSQHYMRYADYAGPEFY